MVGPPPKPPPQIVSPGAHNSIVLAAYCGPITIGGAPNWRIKSSEGFPNRTTAATWSATSGAIGWGMYDRNAAGTSDGTAAEVTKPATAAPCEYPPSTIRVFGQFAAMDWT